ncbi:hypothetical protein L6452_30278 [Arctium lappa]|uniref:Uncharacterized protein n=2 Tax=Arctium lappa TaxID=4217 RepID=A0ACB8ZJ09_ARCLA|nr:hypothetical protein L6452_30277 [Arctium lappa]KAI3697332.1 hypothetical protein L6452_30278 [Arctium lappa]
MLSHLTNDNLDAHICDFKMCNDINQKIDALEHSSQSITITLHFSLVTAGKDSYQHLHYHSSVAAALALPLPLVVLSWIVPLNFDNVLNRFCTWWWWWWWKLIAHRLPSRSAIMGYGICMNHLDKGFTVSFVEHLGYYILTY